MKDIVTTITQRGQVTIPAEVRRKLGLKPRGKVVFRIVDDEVRLTPVELTLEAAFGSVKPLSIDFKEASRRAREERASAVKQEMGQ